MNKKILHCAIGLLSRREHAKKELLQKLQQREYENTEIEAVLEYLIKKNYLSDKRFADCVYRARVSKGYGWLYIKNALAQKEVCSTIIEELRKNDEIDWYLQAELAYNKRFGTSAIAHYEERSQQLKEKAKRIRFLQGRGFATDEIMAVLNHQYSD